MRVSVHLAVTIVTASLLLAACADDQVPLGPAPDTETSYVRDVPLTKLDVLFVVDDSISMHHEQASLTARFDQYVGGLEALEGGVPDLHLAVISTDLGMGGHARGNCQGAGDDGHFRRGALDDCALVDGDFITIEANGGPANHTGTLTEAFACMASLGEEGCGFEQPLESMRRALERDPHDGTSFLRPDAALAVVLLGDEDDCSASDGATLFSPDPFQDTLDSELGRFTSYRCFEFGVVCEPDAPRAVPADGTQVVQAGCRPRDDSPYIVPPSEYVDFLRALKVDPSAIAVTVVNGDPTPVAIVQENFIPDPEPEIGLEASCESAFGKAAPAVRLASFAASFGFQGQLASICEGDVGPALTESTHRVRSAIGLPCLQGRLHDVDQEQADVQPFCQVEAARDFGLASEARTPLPACAGGRAPPCWRTSRDAEHCGDLPSELRFEVDRGGAAPSPDLVYVAECQL